MRPDRTHLVVGGGVMGAALGRALARAGLPVVLLSAGGIGAAGASSVPAALLNPFRGRSGRANPDDLAGLAVTWRWAAELRAEGRDPGAERSGVLRLADGASQARAFARVPGLRRLEPAQVPAPYRGPHGGAWSAEGGSLVPGLWLAALVGSAVAAGARVETGVQVTALERLARGGWRATASDGRSWSAGRVLLATGAEPWPEAWVGAVGACPPFVRHAGDVVTTTLPAPRVPLAGSLYVAACNGPAGRLAAVGGHHRAPGPPEPDVLDRLSRGLAWALPSLTEAAATAAWWGVRAHADGNRPHVGEIAPGVWWCGALAGRGFLVAAALAESVTKTLLRPA